MFKLRFLTSKFFQCFKILTQNSNSAGFSHTFFDIFNSCELMFRVVCADSLNCFDSVLVFGVHRSKCMQTSKDGEMSMGGGRNGKWKDSIMQGTAHFSLPNQNRKLISLNVSFCMSHF